MPTPQLRPQPYLRPPLLALIALFLAAVFGALSARPAHAEKWALLIGIDAYKDSNRINSLGSAAADARAIKKALIEADGFPEDHVRLLVSDADSGGSDAEAKPERNAILRELSRLARNVQPGDTVFVLFSGHGIEKNGQSYLLPYDADAFDDNTITDTAIDITKFRDRLQTVHAGLLLLAFDMCRNNPVKGSRDAAASANTLKVGQVRGLDFSAVTANGGTAPATGNSGPSAVVTLFSCSPDERSYEWADKGRGYFSYFLEQGLRGAKGAIGADGIVRVNTLTRYLSESVPAEVKMDEGGKIQTPYIEIKGQAGASQIALTALGGPAPGVSPIPVAAAGAGSTPILGTDKRAYLNVAVTPANATFFIDGIRQYPIAGRIALDLNGASSKTVELGIQADGYQTRVEQVTLRSGTVEPLAVVLEKAAALPPVVVRPEPVKVPSAITAAPKAGSMIINPIDGAEMIYIPAGPFLMGDDDDPKIQDNPRNTVTLSAYYIYKNPVTVAMYRKYCATTHHHMPPPENWGPWENDHPIVQVTWDDAKAYCEWAGAALPSEAQWEKAARGTDGRKYPWGNDWDPNRSRCGKMLGSDGGYTTAIGSYPLGASPYGVLDMAGNVGQWCADWYDPTYWFNKSHAAMIDPMNSTGTVNHVFRGGSWVKTETYAFRTANRGFLVDTSFWGDIGIRAVIPAPLFTQ